MTATRPTPEPPRPALTGVSMRDLLASCAAADAISRPPRTPDPKAPEAEEAHPKAA